MKNFPSVPQLRIRHLTNVDVNPDGHFVLYWMNAFRRTRYNFSLQHACQQAQLLRKPLVVVEALRTGYQWASDRFHRYVIDGMIDNQAACQKANLTYYPFLETTTNRGHGLIETLGKQACLLIADDFPAFFHPYLYDRIVSKWPINVQLVDSNGLLPMRAAERTFTVAHSFRRFLQKELPKHLDDFPIEEPLKFATLPKPIQLDKKILKRWPVADLKQYAEGTKHFDRFKIDHSVAPISERGGALAAGKSLNEFIDSKIARYQDDRNVPDLRGSSRLSPYLHFGHIAAHEVFGAVMKWCDWDTSKIQKVNGQRSGYWGADEAVESYIDELITWRELGYNMCHREPDYDRYESLPGWARTTLDEHAGDKREKIYTLAELESAQTSDKLWNAAQQELLREGRIHNYLRMLWGKKILQWSQSPQAALAVLIELNNKYAVDGRDPNSYSGIFWVLGRYDRAWGPERKIFGKIRYMTSESTLKKFKMKNYMQQYL